MASRAENLTPEIFLDGPAEFLSDAIKQELILVPQWVAIFGEFIDAYQRMDYGIRNLPALRIYNKGYIKTFDSWFIEGDIILDVIWPAEIRREELQRVPDQVTSAMLQQFRRPSFFAALSKRLPGLNEMGKTLNVDKGLGFEFGGQGSNDIVPLNQISVNFRVDIRQWDLYLERECRTKDDPFERTLKELQKIATTIQGLNDDGSENVDVPLENKI